METIHLQFVGEVPAVPVSELIPGDIVMFNNAHLATVQSIEKVTPQSYKIGWVSEEFDQSVVLYETKRGKTLMARIDKE